MTTYPYPSSLSPDPALTDEATLEAALDCLLEHLPIEMEGGYTPQDLFEILLRAASRIDSIEHTAQRLEGVPSGNGIRYHLDKLDNLTTLEQQLNTALQSRIPSGICNAQHRIAIDYAVTIR
jgi:putative transposase